MSSLHSVQAQHRNQMIYAGTGRYFVSARTARTSPLPSLHPASSLSGSNYPFLLILKRFENNYQRWEKYKCPRKALLNTIRLEESYRRKTEIELNIGIGSIERWLVIEGHVGTADFASRQSGLFYSLDSTKPSTVFLANCRKNSTKS